MSDIPPESPEAYLEAQDTAEPSIRRRGIRSGKAAKRKREAYIRNVLLFTEIEDSSLIPVIHTGGQSRPLYTTKDWEPAYSSSESGGEFEAVEVEIEEPSASSSAKPPAGGPLPTPKAPAPPPKSPAVVREAPQPKDPAVVKQAPQPKAPAVPKVPKATGPPAGYQLYPNP